MELVVDTSVVIAVIANEGERTRIVELTRGVDLLAPPSLHWEVGNALSAMLKRKRITLAQAWQAIAAYQRVPMRLVDVELEEALPISAEEGIYAYDAYVISCALKYQAPLISLDRQLMDVARKLGVTILEVDG